MLFCRYNFFSRPVVTLLRYYERSSADTIFSVDLLLHYYERFSADTIFSVDLLLHYYTITSVYLQIQFFQSTCCYVITLIQALFCKQTVKSIVSVDLFRFSVDKLTC